MQENGQLKKRVTELESLVDPKLLPESEKSKHFVSNLSWIYIIVTLLACLYFALGFQFCAENGGIMLKKKLLTFKCCFK